MKICILVLALLHAKGGLSQNVTTEAGDIVTTMGDSETTQASLAMETTTSQAEVANTTTMPTTSVELTFSSTEPSTTSTKLMTTAEESTTSASCGPPPNNGTSSCFTYNCTANVSRKVSYAPGRVCIDIYVCNSINWMVRTLCDSDYCDAPGLWGTNCNKVCGAGCPGNMTKSCDRETGKCKDPSSGQIVTDCLTGYEGEMCQEPICPLGCGGGECLYPNFCGNCPKHFSSGPTCRNIRLDGFLTGSLPALAILTLIVIALTIASKWYIRRKIKEN